MHVRQLTKTKIKDQEEDEKLTRLYTPIIVGKKNLSRSALLRAPCRQGAQPMAFGKDDRHTYLPTRAPEAGPATARDQNLGSCLWGICCGRYSRYFFWRHTAEKNTSKFQKKNKISLLVIRGLV